MQHVDCFNENSPWPANGINFCPFACLNIPRDISCAAVCALEVNGENQFLSKTLLRNEELRTVYETELDKYRTHHNSIVFAWNAVRSAIRRKVLLATTIALNQGPPSLEVEETLSSLRQLYTNMQHIEMDAKVAIAKNLEKLKKEQQKVEEDQKERKLLIFRRYIEEKNYLWAQNQVLQTSLSTLNEDKKKLEEQVKDLQSSLTAARTNNETVNGQLLFLQQENEKLKESLKQNKSAAMGTCVREIEQLVESLEKGVLDDKHPEQYVWVSESSDTCLNSYLNRDPVIGYRTEDVIILTSSGNGQQMQTTSDPANLECGLQNVVKDTVPAAFTDTSDVLLDAAIDDDGHYEEQSSEPPNDDDAEEKHVFVLDSNPSHVLEKVNCIKQQEKTLPLPPPPPMPYWRNPDDDGQFVCPDFESMKAFIQECDDYVEDNRHLNVMRPGFPRFYYGPKKNAPKFYKPKDQALLNDPDIADDAKNEIRTKSAAGFPVWFQKLCSEHKRKVEKDKKQKNMLDSEKQIVPGMTEQEFKATWNNIIQEYNEKEGILPPRFPEYVHAGPTSRRGSYRKCKVAGKTEHSILYLTKPLWYSNLKDEWFRKREDARETNLHNRKRVLPLRPNEGPEDPEKRRKLQEMIQANRDRRQLDNPAALEEEEEQQERANKSYYARKEHLHSEKPNFSSIRSSARLYPPHQAAAAAANQVVQKKDKSKKRDRKSDSSDCGDKSDSSFMMHTYE